MEHDQRPLRTGLTRRHPVAVFLGILLPVSILMELLWANLAGGWSTWRTGILWYRTSCVVNDVVLAGGAYYGARMLAGPLWWRFRDYPAWTGFLFILTLGGLFLMILARRLVELYEPEAPPFSTGWLAVWHRIWAPFFVLLFVRRLWWRKQPEPPWPRPTSRSMTKS